MPDRREHAEYSKQLYGYDFEEIHKWMDGTSISKGPNHREDRHDINETPKKAFEIFKDEVPEDKIKYIKDVVKDHIELDKRGHLKEEEKLTCHRCKDTVHKEEAIEIVYGYYEDRKVSRIVGVNKQKNPIEEKIEYSPKITYFFCPECGEKIRHYLSLKYPIERELND